MSYRLVIAEKPSVGAAYAKVLGATNRQDGYWEGNGYLVSWCMNRYVRRGSKGIALLDESGGYPRLHYVFDVSDTAPRRNALYPDLWQINDSLKEPVRSMLAENYGVQSESFGQQLADWDTVKSNIFAKTAIRFVQGLPEARLLKSVVVPFEMGISEKPALPTSTAKATKINPAHTISLRQTECRKTGETITAAVYEYLVDNDGEWGELRFDFENGTAEIVKLADWNTTTSNIFAKTAIRYIQGFPEARLLKFVVVPFWKGWT